MVVIVSLRRTGLLIVILDHLVPLAKDPAALRPASPWRAVEPISACHDRSAVGRLRVIVDGLAEAIGRLMSASAS